MLSFYDSMWAFMQETTKTQGKIAQQHARSVSALFLRNRENTFTFDVQQADMQALPRPTLPVDLEEAIAVQALYERVVHGLREIMWNRYAFDVEHTPKTPVEKHASSVYRALQEWCTQAAQNAKGLQSFY